MQTLAVPERSFTIRALIRRATWKSRAVTATEALLAGLAASALTASVARLQGVDELGHGPLAAAALAGLAAAATWWVEHRPDAAKVARRVDRELARGGELFTAFELESHAERGVLEELLLLRARTGVEPRQVARSVPPPSLVFAGAAAAALAGWLGARELAPADAATPLAELVADARAFASAGKASSPAREGARAEVARLAARAAAELERRREPAPELVAALSSALARVASSPGPDADEQAAARELAARARAAAGARAASGAPGATPQGGDSASALAQDGVERTMSPLGSAADAAGEVPDPASGPQVAGAPLGAPGTLAGRWWSARHDAVVSAWIEARRARAATSPNEDDAK